MLLSEAQKLLTVPKEFLAPPGDFNPTLLMFLAALAMLVLSNCGYWLWEWPHWCCFTTNVLALHIAGTVIHDACHQSAHRNRIINAILGHGSALMLAFAFPVFTRVHLQHHAHVNDPENDPDHYVSTGGPLWLINARFLYHEIFFFKRQAVAQVRIVGMVLKPFVCRCYFLRLNSVPLLGLHSQFLVHSYCCSGTGTGIIF